MAFLPKTFDFYSGFDAVGGKIIEASQTLLAIMRKELDGDTGVAKLRELEQEADQFTHSTLERLNRTFITPIDREDIHLLATRLDDVLDLIYAVGGRMRIYRPVQLPPYLLDMAGIIVDGTKELGRAVSELRDTKHREKVLQHCVEINRIENAGDEKLREGLAHLFAHEKDPIELIKLKEILETLEEATDACEHVAHVIEGIVLKHA